MSWVYHPVYLLVWRSSLTSQLLLVQGLGGIPFGNIFLKTLHKSMMACFSHTLSSSSVTLISNAGNSTSSSCWKKSSQAEVSNCSCWCSRNQIGAQKQWNCLNISEVEYAEDDCIKNPLNGNSPFHKCDLYQSPMLMSIHYFSISKRCRLIKYKRHTVINLKQNACLGRPTQRLHSPE